MRMVEVAIAEENSEPVFFKLLGETFECLPHVPASLHAELADWNFSLEKTLHFYDVMLKDEAELERFRKFINGEREIHLQLLVDLMTELVSEYGGKRPLGTSKPSAPGRRKTSRSSKARSKPKGSTPST